MQNMHSTAKRKNSLNKLRMHLIKLAANAIMAIEK